MLKFMCFFAGAMLVMSSQSMAAVIYDEAVLGDDFADRANDSLTAGVDIGYGESIFRGSLNGGGNVGGRDLQDMYDWFSLSVPVDGVIVSWTLDCSGNNIGLEGFESSYSGIPTFDCSNQTVDLISWFEREFYLSKLKWSGWEGGSPYADMRIHYGEFEDGFSVGEGIAFNSLDEDYLVDRTRFSLGSYDFKGKKSDYEMKVTVHQVSESSIQVSEPSILALFSLSLLSFVVLKVRKAKLDARAYSL